MLIEMIKSLADFGGAVANAVAPAILSWVNNEGIRFRKELSDEWEKVAKTPNGVDNAIFIEQLLSQVGHPSGMVSTSDKPIAIPASHLNQLVSATIELAVLKRENSLLLSKIGK